MTPGTRMPNALRLIRELGWVAAGQAAALLVGVVLTKVLTSSLGPEEYGRFALALTVPTLLNQTLFGPLTVAVMRFFSTYAERGLLETMLAVVARALRRAIVVLALASVAVALAVGLLSEDVSWALLVIAAFAFGVVYSLFSLYNTMQVAQRKRIDAAAHQALDPASRLLGATAAIVTLGPSAVSAMLGLIVGAMGVAMSQARSFRRSLRIARPEPRASAPTDVARELWDYGRYYLYFGWSTWALLASDRWALKTFGNDAGVGTYAAAFQLASLPATVAAGAFAQFVIPIVFQRAGDASDAARRRRALTTITLSTLVMAVFIGVSAVVALLAGEPIVVLFTSDAFRQGGAYLPLLVIGLGLMKIGHLLALVPTSFNQMRAYTAIKIGHSLGAVLANAVAAWGFGVVGVCVAQLLIGIAFVILMLWNNVRILRTESQQTPTA